MRTAFTSRIELGAYPNFLSGSGASLLSQFRSGVSGGADSQHRYAVWKLQSILRYGVLNEP